jgi:hypothetical protein
MAMILMSRSSISHPKLLPAMVIFAADASVAGDAGAAVA